MDNNTASFEIILDKEKFSHLIRNNLCCYYNQTLDENTIDMLSKQLFDSIQDFLVYQILERDLNKIDSIQDFIHKSAEN